MSRRTIFMMLLTLLAMTTGCGHDPSAMNEPVPAARLVKIELTAGQALAWPYQQKLEADLDGDGAPESVILMADAEVMRGQPLWEDGHRWAIVVRDGSEETLAYAAFVPRGFVEAAVGQRQSDRTREIIVVERSPDHLTAITIAYRGAGQTEASSASYYQLESWLPRSARIPD